MELTALDFSEYARAPCCCGCLNPDVALLVAGPRFRPNIGFHHGPATTMLLSHRRHRSDAIASAQPRSGGSVQLVENGRPRGIRASKQSRSRCEGSVRPCDSCGFSALNRLERSVELNINGTDALFTIHSFGNGGSQSFFSFAKKQNFPTNQCVRHWQ
jgi:hypothetical protein